MHTTRDATKAVMVSVCDSNFSTLVYAQSMPILYTWIETSQQQSSMHEPVCDLYQCVIVCMASRQLPDEEAQCNGPMGAPGPIAAVLVDQQDSQAPVPF